jgi:hypothetical protein
MDLWASILKRTLIYLPFYVNILSISTFSADFPFSRAPTRFYWFRRDDRIGLILFSNPLLIISERIVE